MDSATLDRLAILILAGGDGRRIGGDKALRRLGGLTLVERARRRASAWSPLVALGVRERGQVGHFAGPEIADDPRTDGPLAALSAGLAWAVAEGSEALLTIACDTPFLPDDLPSQLLGQIGCGQAAVPASAGRLHWTCALWRTTAADCLSIYFASDRRSLDGFASLAGFTAVAWPPGGYDPFANINTPEELRAAEMLLLEIERLDESAGGERGGRGAAP